MPITIAVLLLVIWFVWAYLQTKDKRSPQDQMYRAQAIMARGEPITRQDYHAIFPNACPRCGSRSRYESQANKQRWSCSRCQYDEGRGRLKSPQLRVVTSPFIKPEVADTIAEPIFSGSGYSQVFVHNNHTTTFRFVVKVVKTVFEVSDTVAWAIAHETHTKGRAYIVTLPAQDAEATLRIVRQMVQDYEQTLDFSVEEG